MREICKATRSLGQDLYGWGYNAASPTLNDTFYPFLYQAGGRPLTPGGRGVALNSEAGVRALSFIVELFERGWSSRAWLTPNDTRLQQPFFRKKQVVSIQYKQNAITDVRRNVPDLEFGVTPVLKDREQWGFGALQAWAISSTAKSPAAAAAWIAFLVQPQNALTHSHSFGVMPANGDVATLAYSDDPLLASLRSEESHTFDEQKAKYGRALMPLVIPEIQAAILKRKSPKQALDDAAGKVSALMAKG
jgi:multiple sugar transport system substrate-binding protein